jgi:methylenetetrahydrofolate dehydrogenase (NADP+)/methenyltetrahydrofolate cyclohydrolase
MTDAKIIDGKAFAEGLRLRVADSVATLKNTHGLTPGLAVVLVGEDLASQVYTRNKARQTNEAGMKSFEYKLDVETSQSDLLALISQLNRDDAINGILVQLPLPSQIDSQAVIAAIDSAKDVDGFHVVNSGLLATGGDGLVPCTPLGCLMLLKDTVGDLSGLEAIIVGRSNIVGKPMAALLIDENCTVTIAHSRTRNLPVVCARADILVAAVGRAEMIGGSWIKPGATIIDVGINRIEANEGRAKLVGDVNFSEAVFVAGAITPVPGGVGPMTIACLLRNTVIAACRQNEIAEPEL